jgi:hypothetical protein
MCLPKFPKLAISLPTSAALSVLYFRLVPDIGSNVFSVNVAFGPVVVSALAASASSSGVLRFLDLLSFSGWRILYFVVIRACGNDVSGGVSELGELSCRQYSCWAGLEE